MGVGDRREHDRAGGEVRAAVAGLDCAEAPTTYTIEYDGTPLVKWAGTNE